MPTVKSNIPIFQIGTIVRLKASFMNEPIGTLCCVYEHYGKEGGLSIISINGRDIGGFTVNEQMQYLEYEHDNNLTYYFKNVMQLYDDFRKGIFNQFFIKNH